MSFPDFDNNDEIQVENMGGSHDNQDNFGFTNNYQGSNDNYYNMQQTNDWAQNMGGASYENIVDEEEEKRAQARKKEEDERRAKIISLMNEEIRIKQEFRDKAREYLDNYVE